MDPLSITASTIAIAGVVARLCSILADIRDTYVSLPDRLHALNNEIQDLRVVLDHVAAIAKEREEHGIHGDLESEIPQILSHGKERLAILEGLLCTVRATGLKKRERLTRSLFWRKSQGTLALLQADIKQVKSSLTLLLGASNSRDLMHMRLEFQQATLFTYASNNNTCQHGEPINSHVLLAKMLDHHEQVEQRLAKVEALLLSQAAQLHATQASMIGPLFDPSRPPMRSRPIRSISPASEKMIRSNAEEQRLGQAVRFCPRGPYYVQQGCTPGCSCACHTPKCVASPSFLKQALGQFFVGYIGVPLLGNSSCDTVICQNRQISSINLEYWSPLSFCWSQIIRLRMAYEANVGPSLQLSTLRHVPDTAPCVTFAFTGNVQGLKGLFSQGLASPRDISSTRGYSLLRWALYGQQYEMCRFLIAAGADPTYCPKAWTDDCPRERAYDIILRGGLSREAEDILRVLSQGYDYGEYIEKQNFSCLHKIVAGLCSGDLEEELTKPGADIDIGDVYGRTALDWAAARGDDIAVATLLSYGADPNHTDKRYGTPLSLAANQGHTVCARLLLEAGALANPPLPKGLKTGNPLNVAARNATDPMLLKTLLDFGADIESTGLDGMTPLLGVARGNSAAHAAVLLDYGANINTTSRSGKTPLSAAIEFNNHGVLRLLLAKWFDYYTPAEGATSSGKAKDSKTAKALLEVVARYADLKTTEILLSESSEPLRTILSTLSQGKASILVTPGMDYFQPMLASRAAEFTPTSSSISEVPDKMSPTLEDLIAGFKALLANLQMPPMNPRDDEKDLPRSGSMEKLDMMECGLLGHGTDQRMSHPCMNFPSPITNEDIDDDNDDDDLLVFEDAQEELMPV